MLPASVLSGIVPGACPVLDLGHSLVLQVFMAP